MELGLILERLRLATGQKSDRAMVLFLGLKGTITGGWKERGTIPFQACLIAEQKTDYLMRWLLTGEGPQKHGEVLEVQVEEEKLINDFAEIIIDGIELDFLCSAKDTSEETIAILGKKLYKKVTGKVSIPSNSNWKKSG